MERIDRLSDTELSILQYLWEHGEATSREITIGIYGEMTEGKMSSVQKLIERMEAKGCIDRNRGEKTHRFRARASREQYLRSRLQALADRICDGTLVPLVSTLVQSKGFSKKEREELRKLLGNL
jgi:predicted transcriptional regulator